MREWNALGVSVIRRAASRIGTVIDRRRPMRHVSADVGLPHTRNCLGSEHSNTSPSRSEASMDIEYNSRNRARPPLGPVRRPGRERAAGKEDYRTAKTTLR